MRKKRKRICSILLGIAIVMSQLTPFITHVPSAAAAIPVEYRPNYKFDTERNKIEEIKTAINAARQQGKAISTSLFSNLLKNFTVVFEHLPQIADYKVVYGACKIGAGDLSISYDINQFSLFNTNCLMPLDNIFKEIANSHTVTAKASATPSQGSAPMNVTFLAGGSEDKASNQTIPSKNYFWYYTDTNGVEQAIGQGPTVNYTFSKEGKYIVHLTVRSISDGVFDGSTSITINVGPQSANMYVFANGKRLQEENSTKFTSQEAADGLTIDGTATTPLGGRKILAHEWTVLNGDDAMLYKKGTKSAPGSFKVPLQGQGIYTVILKIVDNENNNMEKKYTIIISDPVATIKITPTDGNSSSIYSFDASTSYSVESTLKTYQWNITDANGNEILNEKNKTFQYKAFAPGTYRVKLKVTDQMGNNNEDAVTLYVGSTPPVPQFSITPVKNWAKPSSFILDASPSYDIDTRNGGDVLTYDRSFDDNEDVVIDQTFDDGKRIKASFKEKGTYKATLTIKDNFGKVEQTTKEIVVDSALRPQIFATPISSKVNTDVSFAAKTNKAIANYTRDFGDGAQRTIDTDKIVHRYQKVGTYKVKLTVTTEDGDSNDVYVTIFVGEADSPIPGYSVTNGVSDILIPEGICKDPSGEENPAYYIERYENITINGGDSINVAGGKNNLSYYFKPQIGDTTKRQTLSYKFDEVGCQFVDFTVEDTAISKTASKRIWFVVRNAKPTIQNVIMNFPQVGNSYGIGIGQNANKDMFSTIEADPLVIKLDAINAIDSDGSISKYKWYYYNVEDPERRLEIKFTPANIPYTYFSIPRIAGEYRFGVEVYDNDGEYTKSEAALGKGPVVFFPPDTKNPDIPIATLKIDKPNTKIGEEITLEVISKITSNRTEDFENNRVISYDFDGDGVRDTTTKNSKITYIYKTIGTFSPRVKVTYRGRSGIAYGEKVVVDKGIKINFLYAIVGNTLLVRDTSYGEIVSRKFCADARQCTNNSSWLIENQTYFKKDYLKAGVYPFRYEVQDQNGSISSTGGLIKVYQTEAPVADSIAVVTLPAPTSDGHVSIGKILDNKVMFYVAYNGQGDCYIDTDISQDSTNSGHPDQNRDIPSCNTQILYEYKNAKVGSTIARIYYTVGSNLVSKDLTIQFIDYDVTLSQEKEELYNIINTTLENLGDYAPDVKTILLALRNAIVEGSETSSLILQLKDIIENQSSQLPAKNQQEIQDITKRLEDKTTLTAQQGTDYDISKTAVIGLFPANRKAEIAKLFEEIENAAGDKPLIKNNLFKIENIGQEEVKKGSLDETDYAQLKTEICNMILYYEITGTSCVGEDGIITETPNNSEGTTTNGGSSILRKVVKTIGIIVGILGVGFIILIVIFALKAKKKQENA